MKTNFNKFLILFSFLFFGVLIGSNSAIAQTKDLDVSYVKIEVNGLACPFCAYGLEKKLKKLKGVEKITIDVKEGLSFLTILEKDKPSEESIRKIIKNAGFTPETITFSKKPFPTNDSN